MRWRRGVIHSCLNPIKTCCNKASITSWVFEGLWHSPWIQSDPFWEDPQRSSALSHEVAVESCLCSEASSQQGRQGGREEEEMNGCSTWKRKVLLNERSSFGLLPFTVFWKCCRDKTTGPHFAFLREFHTPSSLFTWGCSPHPSIRQCSLKHTIWPFLITNCDKCQTWALILVTGLCRK